MTASRSKSPRRDSLDLSPGLRHALREFLRSLEADLSAGSLSAYRRDLTGYLARATRRGIESPADLAPAVARDHVSALLQAGRSPATVARCLSSMRRFHRHLQRQGACLADPTDGVATPPLRRPQPQPLTVDEAHRLLSAVEGVRPLELRDRAILEVLYGTGLRTSELTALDLEDLHLHRGHLRVGGRRSRQRLVPLGWAAMAALRQYLRQGRHALQRDATTSALFLNARGRTLTRMGVWKIVRAASLAAGIDRRVNPQTLRHTCAAHLLEGGFEPGDLQRLLGHADMATTSFYWHADDEQLADMHHACHPRA